MIDDYTQIRDMLNNAYQRLDEFARKARRKRSMEFFDKIWDGIAKGKLNPYRKKDVLGQ